MMTTSQKIARFFEIVNYVMLLPAAFGIFASTLLLAEAPWFPMIVLAISAFGLMLLIRYFKHSRGRLAQEKIKGMWLGTIGFNLLFLLPSVYIIFQAAIDDRFPRMDSIIAGSSIVGFLIFIWWIVSIIGAGIALKSGSNDQKYR